jgi:predicted RND superfamily exporter protein
MKLHTRVARAYADLVVRRPAAVLIVLAALVAVALFGVSRLGLNTNQLDLISEDLPQVKDVQRVVDMVGGTGYLMMVLRGDDEQQLKAVGDDLHAQLIADTENVRFITFKVPVEFIQQNMVLFVDTEDLKEVQKRINTYMRALIRANNPFAFDLGAQPAKREPPTLDVKDIVEKYSKIGKKSILDDYYISNDRKMVLLLIKPMWNAPELGRTEAYVESLRRRLQAYSASNARGAKLAEDYAPLDMPDGIPVTGSVAAQQYKAADASVKVAPPGTLTYGFTGSYKTVVDDSTAIRDSLTPPSPKQLLEEPSLAALGQFLAEAARKPTLLAFFGIVAVMLVFFRKVVPIFVTASGTVLGTVLTIGFAWATVGELNMITSMLGAILMGLGVDFGFHLTNRMRLELGAGKRYDAAIRDAVVNAGVPAFISAIATSGAFFALLFSQFRGFSQFGFLAGFGTFIIGLTLFSWTPALLSLLGRMNPELPRRLLGSTPPPKDADKAGNQLRFPRPVLTIVVFGAVALLLGMAALPLREVAIPKDRAPTLAERIQAGVRFNYNTRALIPEDQPSVKLQDEIGLRFDISSDPVAVYTRTLEEAKKIWDEFPPQMRGAGAAAAAFGKDFSEKQRKYSTVDQVVSIYTFVPPPELAVPNAALLEAWHEQLKEDGITPEALPPQMQENGKIFEKILGARPFGVDGVSETYRSMFTHLPTSRPENHGWLTFIYPQVDLWDGKNMLQFVAQVEQITTEDGSTFRSAGLPILYSKLANIVLFDGKLTVALTAVWLLVILLLDLRSVRLALAALLPLGLGMFLMLGVMAVLDVELNFMNICVLPIVLGYGVSHGVYLVHRFLEGTSPMVALRSVGVAVLSSTLTTVAGFGALYSSSHPGLKSLGLVTCIGLVTTLFTTFTLLGAVLQLMHDRRVARAAPPEAPPADGTPAAEAKSAAA